MSALRERALAEAMSWIGTPYQHQASAKGLGCDCLGLVRGVWRTLYGSEPQAVPPYRADWAEVSGQERLLAAARRWLVQVPTERARPGDVVLFRMAPEAAIKHCALISHTGPPGRIVHAYWGRAVTESWLGDWWRSRLVAAFAFPETED
ncbi:MAG TPA: NlpC/P60 family protein [Brevundimonas sp.]|jgi:NlpC/P60 family putative phage cell wall peptidase|uniref:NlpC/P60 family protein n=1 Tax=Brevundimonas sp. TaxID=1871086 RepID=UPI002BBD0EAA|nr:NlpC/P60 family protein [Brevundimonas sp.]HRH19451.1 NlpC/P60 family protein [Brevundimonas sp.]